MRRRRLWTLDYRWRYRYSQRFFTPKMKELAEA